jgi:hypothetical protein
VAAASSFFEEMAVLVFSVLFVFLFSSDAASKSSDGASQTAKCSMKAETEPFFPLHFPRFFSLFFFFNFCAKKNIFLFGFFLFLIRAPDFP